MCWNRKIGFLTIVKFLRYKYIGLGLAGLGNLRISESKTDEWVNVGNKNTKIFFEVRFPQIRSFRNFDSWGFFYRILICPKF